MRITISVDQENPELADFANYENHKFSFEYGDATKWSVPLRDFIKVLSFAYGYDISDKVDIDSVSERNADFIFGQINKATEPKSYLYGNIDEWEDTE